MNQAFHAIVLAGVIISLTVTGLAGLAAIWIIYRTTKDRRWLLLALLGVPGLIFVVRVIVPHFAR